MALYKERKVNPMAGCLPMLIQIPVFFALFTVLRSAVELRFAEFLWIRDLSEQEGLLAGVLPIPLNILPLVMTLLTLYQQKLTPAVGDPQQQKIMMFMPVMFLFLFYPMPSALVLYWTTSQLIAVVQLVLQQRKKAAQDGGLATAKA
jgi:YidC/Oxa1 family membrane protein insertase